MPIEKLDPNDARPSTVIDKLNELIDDYNSHYHKSLDTQYFTTSPWEEKVEVKDYNA